MGSSFEDKRDGVHAVDEKTDGGAMRTQQWSVGADMSKDEEAGMGASPATTWTPSVGTEGQEQEEVKLSFTKAKSVALVVTVTGAAFLNVCVIPIVFELVQKDL